MALEFGVQLIANEPTESTFGGPFVDGQVPFCISRRATQPIKVNGA